MVNARFASLAGTGPEEVAEAAWHDELVAAAACRSCVCPTRVIYYAEFTALRNCVFRQCLKMKNSASLFAVFRCAMQKHVCCFCAAFRFATSVSL